MPAPIVPSSSSLFTRTLEECRELYVSSGKLCAHEYPHLIEKKGDEFICLMDDLHRALVLKVYFAVVEADRHWSESERYMAELAFEHLWNKRLTGKQLRQAAQEASEDVGKLRWYSLIRPFDRIVPLRDRVGTLETLVTRLANLIARADGELREREANVIKSIQDELRHHLRQIPIDEPTVHEEPNAASAQAIEELQAGKSTIYSDNRIPAPKKKSGPAKPLATQRKSHEEALSDAITELDSLIGLESVKTEVRTLVNYLKLQKRRNEAGLPGADMTLHMVFTGNPGTGKTTVARILGKIFGAMGILSKGHLVETDRSGMVAEYMGQTCTKAQAKINEALDGVLFIDEAYSLVSQQGQDTYGNEAIQTLLKRAEDDRGRLVVILAGYPNEIRNLLKTNPGLSSRFNRMLHFDDYTPLELARIFGSLCEKNHYRLAPNARARLVLGLTELHRLRDFHFGNGRTVRNLFELAIRRMANRIADVHELSADELVELNGSDIEFVDPPAANDIDHSDDGPWRFIITCPGCNYTTKSRGSYLGKKVRCPNCQHDFTAEWGEPCPAA